MTPDLLGFVRALRPDWQGEALLPIHRHCTRLRALRAYPTHGQQTAIQFVDVVRWKLPFNVENGLLDTPATILLVPALRGGDLLIVAVLTSISPALTALIGCLVLRERLALSQIAGIAPAHIAVSLAARQLSGSPFAENLV